jgi:CMP-N,N'-diacetyllegionaminic acid synthase
MKVLITICARGGSKGIPGKNIKPILGKPLINYTIELTQRLINNWDAKVALSTDDPVIKQIAKTCNLHTEYNRPSNLATDKAGKIDTIKDLLIYEETLINEKYDYILDLDITSPLRTSDDIKQSFELLLNTPEAKTLFSVNKAHRNPYFNMVEKDLNGFYTLVKKNKSGTVMSRQRAPQVYDLNASFYWYRRDFFDKNFKSPITNKSLIYVMEHICFDLDYPIDFLFLEYLLKNKKLDFQL